MSRTSKGGYTLSGEKLPHAVTKVRSPGVPGPIVDGGTPIQPIVIRMPQTHELPVKAFKGPDLWSTVATILISTILSGTVTVYVARQFLDEYSTRIQRQEQRLETLERNLRSLENTATKHEAQIEHLSR